jgi:hypothetical protein
LPKESSKKSLSELKALLAAARADALGAAEASKLSGERADAMDYYLGDMSKDMPHADGRSGAVSTDVADTIEGLMPSLMEIFTGSDEVVRFDPVGPEDIAAAEQETDYVNHVFMQQNPGFLILYSFIKDALLSKVGVVKVWWEEKEEESRETYLDQPDDAFALLAADPSIEIVAHTAHESPFAPGMMLHDVTVMTRSRAACARVEGVPPEEFGIARDARSIRQADYCYHAVTKAEADLIAQGYDRAQMRALPSADTITDVETFARDTVNEHAGLDAEASPGMRPIRVTEHYIRMDYEGEGKPRLYRVTTAGDEAEVLNRGGEPDIVPVAFMPFAAMTPVIVTHRFFGRSIADLVMDIQRIKTALIRAILDNAYLAVNPRVEVAEAFATETTLDDLLVSRPGGIVRTKQPGGLNWQAVPSIAGAIFPVLEYADAAREWRTGVTRQGQGIDANALQNASATAVSQVYSAAQARMTLVARIFAETGIRDLFTLLHATIRQHGAQAQIVRLRNRWATVDPRDWKSRNDMTINVGLGTGSKAERLAHVMAVINLQKEALAGGLTNLISAQNLYNAAREVVKLVDLKDPDLFFTDPKTQPPPAPRPDPHMLEVETKTKLEKNRVQADIVTQNKKIESEMALAQQKFELQRQMTVLEMELKRELHRQALAENMVKGSRRRRVRTGEAAAAEMPDALPLIAELLRTLQQLNAPKRVVRDAEGRVSHLEPVEPVAPA